MIDNVKIKIGDFLCIKNADIEFSKFNIIIGEQAAGKSIILKLAHFFNSACGQYIIDTIKNEEGVRFYKNILHSKFNDFFYSTGNEIGRDTYIEYKRGGTKIKIEGRKRGKVSIEISEDIKTHINKMKAKFKSMKSSKNMELFSLSDISIIDKVVRENFKDCSHFFDTSIFVPSSRSFFAIIKDNIFSFLKENIDMDIFMKEFGGIYEISKRIYNRKDMYEEGADWIDYIDKIQDSVIKGRYKNEEKEDIIISNDIRVKLSKASSGQQEALPLIMVLSTFPIVKFIGSLDRKHFFIEEPEAHLFPDAQKRLLQALATIPARFNYNMYISTHSPYMVSEINTILLYNLVKDNIPKEYEEKYSMLPDFYKETLRAYSIYDGKVDDMYNIEDGLIESDLLDNVAVETDSVYDDLLRFLEANDG